MKLYVMRHGPAEDDSPSGRDGDRALTPRGRDRVRDVARALHKAGEDPLLLLSSPLARALQTAEILAAALRSAPGKPDGAPDIAVQVRRELEPGGNGPRLIRELVDGTKAGAMVVGHEPDLTDLVTTLLGAPAVPGMAKAMVVGLDADGKAQGQEGLCTLRWVLDPKTLHFTGPLAH